MSATLVGGGDRRSSGDRLYPSYVGLSSAVTNDRDKLSLTHVLFQIKSTSGSCESARDRRGGESHLLGPRGERTEAVELRSE